MQEFKDKICIKYIAHLLIICCKYTQNARYTQFLDFLGVFAKLRKVTIRFVISVCLSVHPSAWKNSVPTVRTLMKQDIGVFFKKKMPRQFRVSLYSHKNNLYYTHRLVYIYNNISLHSSLNEKCFRQKL
jgi:hypothetical protein